MLDKNSLPKCIKITIVHMLDNVFIANTMPNDIKLLLDKSIGVSHWCRGLVNWMHPPAKLRTIRVKPDCS
jgi:hypothetical protein